MKSKVTKQAKIIRQKEMGFDEYEISNYLWDEYLYKLKICPGCLGKNGCMCALKT